VIVAGDEANQHNRRHVVFDQVMQRHQRAPAIAGNQLVP